MYVCCFLYNFYLCLKTWHSFPPAKLQHDAIDTQRTSALNAFLVVSLFFIIFLSLFNFNFFFCILNCWQANCQLNVQQIIMRSTRGRSLFCSYSARHFNYLQINSAHCVYEALAPTKNSITRINNNNNSITCQAARCVANWRRYKSQD